MSTNARTVIKKAVPCYTRPCLSAPFKKDEIAIPIEITNAMIVKGIGIWSFPTDTHLLLAESAINPNGHTLTQLSLNKM